MCKLNPRVDFVFKKLFGAEENKDILIDFINSIVSEEDHVHDLDIKNPYNDKDFANDKLSIMDIKARDKNGVWFNIEMQMIDQEYYAQRALYYWSRLYVSQLSTGINYDRLEKTIGINILNFNCLKEKHYHNEYRLINIDSKDELIKHLQIHFVELEKYDEKISNLMDRWVNFLKKAGEYTDSDLPSELKNIASIQKAMNVLNTMQLNNTEREHFEARLKWLRDEKAALLSAENKGREKGHQEGRAEGRAEGRQEGRQEGEKEKQKEIAMNMITKGLDHKIISDTTGLSLEHIQQLSDKCKL